MTAVEMFRFPLDHGFFLESKIVSIFITNTKRPLSLLELQFGSMLVASPSRTRPTKKGSATQPEPSSDGAGNASGSAPHASTSKD